MDKEGQERPEGWGASSRRLAVIRGHLNGSGAGSSAPMSSSKAEVKELSHAAGMLCVHLQYECKDESEKTKKYRCTRCEIQP